MKMRAFYGGRGKIVMMMIGYIMHVHNEKKEVNRLKSKAIHSSFISSSRVSTL